MKADPYELQRFLKAQAPVFEAALAELRQGRKRGHWIWFILPQLQHLGRSEMARFYGIRSLAEAQAYLAHPQLGPRLRQCVQALLSHAGKLSPLEIMGSVDAMKLRSSLTLFEAAGGGELFSRGLDFLFGGERDRATLDLLGGLTKAPAPRTL